MFLPQHAAVQAIPVWSLFLYDRDECMIGLKVTGLSLRKASTVSDKWNKMGFPPKHPKTCSAVFCSGHAGQDRR